MNDGGNREIVRLQRFLMHSPSRHRPKASDTQQSYSARVENPVVWFLQEHVDHLLLNPLSSYGCAYLTITHRCR